MADRYIGSPLRRREDARLVRGEGRYAGDIRLERLAHLGVVRSPLANGFVRGVDLTAARALSGVLGAWAAADLPELPESFPGSPVEEHQDRFRQVLARERVRFAGEPVAVVVAETAYAAADAAEAVLLDVEALPGAGDVEAARRPGAPLVHEDVEGNLCGSGTRSFGDVDAAFGEGAVAVHGRFRLGRVAGASMEPRTVTADHRGESLTVWTSTSSVYGVRDALAAMLGLDRHSVRVLAHDVGGSFGSKGSPFPEEVLCALASKRLGRPVRWTASRSEEGATTNQAHGIEAEVELAAGPDGRLRGLRARIAFPLGAYRLAAVSTNRIVQHLVSCYRLPALSVTSELVYTNQAPTGFIRGGSRPVGNFLVERMMDRLARRLGIDRAEIRRRNLIQPEEMPYDTGLPQQPPYKGRMTYDGGDYPRLLETVLEKGGYEELLREQEAGRPIGIGVTVYTEQTGQQGRERAGARLEPDGTALFLVGSSAGGQGHETAFAQVAADRLGLPIESVRVRVGDTENVESSHNTSSSRSAVELGNATATAGRALREELLRRAGELLEADPADLELSAEGVSVRGVPARSVPLERLAGAEVSVEWSSPINEAFSSGAVLCAVEVDAETGSVNILRYVTSHDSGRAINPLIVDGQLHGGYAHGLGYALFEEAVYEPDGSFRSPSFLDYTIASAPEVAVVPEIEHLPTPTPQNPEGFRGAGESATIPVPAAIANAVEDALHRQGFEAGVDELPITPQRLYEATRR